MTPPSFNRGVEVSKKRRRRSSASNRRLPTASVTSFNPPRFLNNRSAVISGAELSRLFGRTQLLEPLGYSRVYKAQDRAFVRRPAKRVQEVTNHTDLVKNVFQGGSLVRVHEEGPLTKTPPEICAARAQRSEVLHATGQAGRKGQRKPRFTAASKLRCK